MMNSVESLASQARRHLDEQQADNAIEILRNANANESAELCALLAEAYFMRGDTKGDLYAASFLASRAIELGLTNATLLSIKAIAAFRKEAFAEAAEALGHYVTESSPTATRQLMGLATLYSGKAAEALPWLTRALADDPDNVDLQQAVAEAEHHKREPVAAPEKPRYWLGGVNDTRAKDVDTPYTFNALTKLRGVSTHAKDLYWLAENIP
jgi:TPR repeat protein